MIAVFTFAIADDPVNVCGRCAKAIIATTKRTSQDVCSYRHHYALSNAKHPRSESIPPRGCHLQPNSLNYSPGVIRWAVKVPAFMIQTVPHLPLSGKPSDCVVAPGTAIVKCVRYGARRGPSGDTKPIRIRASRGCRLFRPHRMRLRLRLIADRFNFNVLRRPSQIAFAGAFHHERLLARHPGLVVADQALVPVFSVSYVSSAFHLITEPRRSNARERPSGPFQRDPSELVRARRRPAPAH